MILAAKFVVKQICISNTEVQNFELQYQTGSNNPTKWWIYLTYSNCKTLIRYLFSVIPTKI